MSCLFKKLKFVLRTEIENSFPFYPMSKLDFSNQSPFIPMEESSSMISMFDPCSRLRPCEPPLLAQTLSPHRPDENGHSKNASKSEHKRASSAHYRTFLMAIRRMIIRATQNSICDRSVHFLTTCYWERVCHRCLSAQTQISKKASMSEHKRASPVTAESRPGSRR